MLAFEVMEEKQEKRTRKKIWGNLYFVLSALVEKRKKTYLLTFSPLRSSSNTFSALHVVDRNRSRGGNASVLRMPEHFLEWSKIFQIRSRWSHLTKKAKTFVIASLVHVYVPQILWFSYAQIFEHLSRLIHRRN